MPDADVWMTAVTVGRWVNIFLGTAALIMLFTAVRNWKLRSAGNRFLWLGVLVFLANVVYGSAEQLSQGSAAGWRTAITTVAAAYVLAALILKRQGRWHENDLPHGGNDGSDGRE